MMQAKSNNKANSGSFQNVLERLLRLRQMYVSDRKVNLKIWLT